MSETKTRYTKKDFMSDQDVRWCPGCGDYSILAAVQKVMPELGVDREKIVFISGIGCAARFPYYMNAYGFHTIHGRAPALATGVKIMNRDLSVWVVSGDGDALSIGGNHIIHCLRRNVNLNVLLFNNEVYGLTKGQLSPTSTQGTITKTSPFGSLSVPVRPLNIALGAEAGFIARTADILGKHMQQMLREAHAHHGASFVEILQNCHIFNDGVFKNVTDKNVRDDRLLFLEDGKPMIFGAELDKGIIFNREETRLEAVSLKDVDESEILIHDPHSQHGSIHRLIANMHWPDHPTAMGVIRAVPRPPFEDQVADRRENAIAERGKGDLMKLLYRGETWEVK